MVDEIEHENFKLQCQVDNLQLKLESLERKAIVENRKEKDCSIQTNIIDDSAIEVDLSHVSRCTSCNDDSCLPPDKALLNQQGCNYCGTEFESMKELLQSVKCFNHFCDDCYKFCEVQPWFKPPDTSQTTSCLH